MQVIQNCAVIGAGTMGSGIAQVAASAGLPVTMIDASADALGRGMQRIQDSLARLVKKGTLKPEDAEAITKRIKPSPELSEAGGADLVIEAIFEDEAVKRATWEKLNAACRADAIFASNTSSISISRLAAAVANPERFIGMHFFNPVPVMKLIEVIRGNRTSPEACATVVELSKRLGKNADRGQRLPRLHLHRVLMPLINEAIFAVYEGVAKPEAIDEIFKLGMAHPMGPLTLADFIGLDVCLNIMEVLQRGFRRSQVPPLSAAAPDGRLR